MESKEFKNKRNKTRFSFIGSYFTGYRWIRGFGAKKEDPFIAPIPVIILSNLGQKEDVDRGLSLGAVDYLIKAHFTPGEIIEKVRNIIKQ